MDIEYLVLSIHSPSDILSLLRLTASQAHVCTLHSRAQVKHQGVTEPTRLSSSLSCSTSTPRNEYLLCSGDFETSVFLISLSDFSVSLNKAFNC